MSRLFVLHLSGHSCAGKSTLSGVLEEKLAGTYAIAYDRMKWQVFGYDPGKDGPLVDRLVLGLFEVACRQRIPILLDFYFKDEEEYLSCREIAEGYGYDFISVELTAPLEVRLKRFHDRVADAKETGTKISVTDEAVFLRNAAKTFYLPAGTPSFDTSTMSMPEIAERVLGLLGN